MASLSEKVRSQRKNLNLSQEQLSNLVGVSRRSIICYETGGAYPRKHTLRRLSEALGVTTKYFTRNDCDNPQEGIDEESFVQDARDAFDKKSAGEMTVLLTQDEALFSGNTLSEDQKDMFFEAISRAYFSSKQKAREKSKRRKRKHTFA